MSRIMKAKGKIVRHLGVNVYKKARSMPGLTGDNMVELLERRLDNSVFRMGLAASRSQARQFVSHGHIRLNNRRATIPSQLVAIGDEVAIFPKENSRKMVRSFMAEADQKAYFWFTFDEDELKGRYLSAPAVSELPLQVDLQMVVEFYAR